MKNLKIGDKELMSERTQESLADQMFEGLGYIEYESDRYINTRLEIIIFEPITKEIVMEVSTKNESLGLNVSADLHLAIHRKLKELGWI